jgi:hypothetical protein
VFRRFETPRHGVDRRPIDRRAAPGTRPGRKTNCESLRCQRDDARPQKVWPRLASCRRRRIPQPWLCCMLVATPGDDAASLRFPVPLRGPCRQHTKLQLMQVLTPASPILPRASGCWPQRRLPSQSSTLTALPVGCLDRAVAVSWPVTQIDRTRSPAIGCLDCEPALLRRRLRHGEENRDGWSASGDWRDWDGKRHMRKEHSID